MTKLLVSAVRYPHSNGDVSLMYVHVRNLFYISQGLEVIVLNFGTQEDYEIDGVKVICLNTYIEKKDEYDVFVAHAAQIETHLPFLEKFGDNFKQYVFFFHGYEVLRVNKVYPKPYSYIQPNPLKRLYQYLYDEIHDLRKLRIWRKFFLKNNEKIHYVFVSKWMLEEFLKWTRVPFKLIEERYMITYNCVGKLFETNFYHFDLPKEYDFITIRSYLNGSKYCIDIVNRLAFANPESNFLVVGKGEFFTHNKKAPNLTWLNQTMNHDQIIEHLQKAKCALMPTRTDAQGLMMCEMATFGIPVITSDIPVCHEALDDFQNVAFIDNENPTILLKPIYDVLASGLPYPKNTKYYNANTSGKEVILFKEILEQYN